SISGKTASLFAAACRIGGIVAELDRTEIDAVTEFGEAYGMAFQIVDDVLDIVATEEILGKPAGNDLVEGVYTLPVLRALSLERGDELRELLTRPLPVSGTAEAIAFAAASGHDPVVDPDIDLTPLDDDTVQRILTLVRRSGGIESALESAREQVARATGALAPFDGSDAAAALVGAAHHLLESVEAIAVRHRT